MTTKTSPSATSKVTSRTAAVQPVSARSWSRGRSAYGVPTILSACGPNTFHRLRTEIAGAPGDAVGLVISCLLGEPAARGWREIAVDVLGLEVLVQA